MLTNLPDVTNRLRDKIKQMLVDLLPDDKLGELIKKEVDGFLNDKWNNWNNSSTPSGLKQTIRTELDLEMRGRIKTWLAENITNIWDGNAQALQVTKELAAELAPIVQESIVRTTIEQIVQSIRNNIR